MADVVSFFREHSDALPVYRALEKRILEEIEGVSVKVSKTQIAFSNKRNFAFASFVPVRRAAERPASGWLTVTFGLASKNDSSRIDVAVEPYPGRWTHHVMVSGPDDIDDELMGWIREAAAFSAMK